MSKTVKDFVSEAETKTDGSVSAKEAHEAGSLILDVREPAELTATGAVADALHIPRGILEFKADVTSDMVDPTLKSAKEAGRSIHVLCASGGRAVLAAATLREMGYEAKRITGGLNGWKEAGLPVESGG